MSAFLDYIRDYNREVEPFIKDFFDTQIHKVSSISPVAVKLLKDYRDFMSGGKKLRGALVCLGYEMFGGGDRKEILKASLVIEIIHSALLIHDDFMDQDELRRGRMTMHKKYANRLNERFGNAMAINLGDAGFFIALKLLNNLKFDPEKLSAATDHVSGLLTEVVLGQAMDITFEEEKRFSEEEVMLVHRFKTADYTVPGPISLGAILAGAGDQGVKKIMEYGIPLGIAFQIKDDELGMFGSVEEIGKAVDSDIKEGKVTLLIVKALELSKGEDRNFLLDFYGKRELSEDEVEKIRSVVIESGAQKYSQDMTEKLIEKGIGRITGLGVEERYQDLLREVGEFVIGRSR